jgi:hypothetical protein
VKCRHIPPTGSRKRAFTPVYAGYNDTPSAPGCGRAASRIEFASSIGLLTLRRKSVYPRNRNWRIAPGRGGHNHGYLLIHCIFNGGKVGRPANYDIASIA